MLGSLSTLVGLGRAARRQLATTLGETTQDEKTIQFVKLLGIDLKVNMKVNHVIIDKVQRFQPA